MYITRFMAYALAVLAGGGWAAAGAAEVEYPPLTDLQMEIANLAAGSGGYASFFRLKDAGGQVIETEGQDAPDASQDWFRRNIWCLKIAKGGALAGRVNILVLANQHGDEWVGHRAALILAGFLMDKDHRASDAWPAGDARFDRFRKSRETTVRSLLDNANVYIIPVVNAEGYQYSLAAWPHDWRKNRRDTSGDPETPWGRYWDGSVASGGVDLNRNWSTADWSLDETRIFPLPSGTTGQVHTSWYKTSKYYCGKPQKEGDGRSEGAAPYGEKEIAGIQELAKNTFFSAAIDVHTFGDEVGWAENADYAGRNLRPKGILTDAQLHRQVATQALALFKDPGNDSPYTLWADNPFGYSTSGDVLWYLYEKSGKRTLTCVLELGPWGSHPAGPAAHGNAVLPAELLVMFSTLDKDFAGKPKARELRKP